MSAKSNELQFLGSRALVLIDGDATDGGFALVEMRDVPPGDMPPLHVHHAEDEGFYVLEGQVTLHLPERQITCGPGEFALAPRGVPHTYRVGEHAASWLVLSCPAGFERFVAAVSELEAPHPQALAAIAAEHRIEILGPPGALP